MQTRRPAGIEVHSRTATYLARRESGHADIEYIQQTVQDRVRGKGRFGHMPYSASRARRRHCPGVIPILSVNTRRNAATD